MNLLDRLERADVAAEQAWIHPRPSICWMTGSYRFLCTLRLLTNPGPPRGCARSAIDRTRPPTRPSHHLLSTIITDTDRYRKQRWKRRQRSRFWWSITLIDLDPIDRVAILLCWAWMNDNEWIVMTRKRRQLKIKLTYHINYVLCAYVRIVEGITLLYP